MYAAEQRLLGKGAPRHASVDGWLALPIRKKDSTLVASLTVSLGVATRDFEATIDGLGALARIIETEIVRDDAAAPDFLHHVVHGQRDPVAVLSLDMIITWMSASITSLIGRTPQEMIGRPATDFIHPDDVETTLNAVIRMSQGLYATRAHLRILGPTGAYFPVEVTGTDLSENPDVGGLVLSIRDDQRDLEDQRAIDRTEQLAKAIVSSLRDGVIATDEFGAVVTFNDTARAMFEIDRDVAPASLSPKSFMLESVEGHPHDPFSSSASTNTVCRLNSSNGEERFVTTSVRRINDSTGHGIGRVVVFSDLTAEHKAAEELRTQAMHDQLTGLANRRQLEHHLRKIETERPEIFVAACFIDLDNFKAINDVYGHDTGDKLVRIAAQRLSEELGPDDLLVRQGGDEFVALMVDPDSYEDTTLFAERCRVALAKPFYIDGHRHDVSGSIGVALAPADRVSRSDLLQQADMALYAAKDGGRNRVHYFDEELAVTVRTTEARRKRLKRSLEAGQLLMHFQPIVDANSELTLGYEALARVSTPRGVLPPSAFLENLTAKSLMWDLDQTAFGLSCLAARQLLDLAPDTPPFIACNFSSVSLNHPDFLSMLTSTVKSAGVPPEMISVELTESSAFEASNAGKRSLVELTDSGFRLVLDDFGTGYSSLSHIKDLPISTLKMDRSFVTALGTNVSERAIAEAVVRLANDLNFLIVAEGVETAEQLEQARRVGFSAIQGWYFSEAIDLERTLENWRATRAAVALPLAS